MAVGDLISQAQTTAFTYQPAAGVQICILQFIARGANATIQGRGNINDTFALSQSSGWNNTVELRNYLPSQKFFIDNNSYLYFNTSAQITGFVGIQTK